MRFFSPTNESYRAIERNFVGCQLQRATFYRHRKLVDTQKLLSTTIVSPVCSCLFTFIGDQLSTAFLACVVCSLVDCQLCASVVDCCIISVFESYQFCTTIVGNSLVCATVICGVIGKSYLSTTIVSSVGSCLFTFIGDQLSTAFLACVVCSLINCQLCASIVDCCVIGAFKSYQFSTTIVGNSFVCPTVICGVIGPS